MSTVLQLTPPRLRSAKPESDETVWHLHKPLLNSEGMDCVQVYPDHSSGVPYTFASISFII